MRIFVWVVTTRIKGDPKPNHIGYAMASDGAMLCQRAYDSVDWAKAGLGLGADSTVNRKTYEEAYPSGYDLVWLDDRYASADWWVAWFYDQRRYKIRFVRATDGDPAYVEFRDAGTGLVLGHVVEHTLLVECYYAITGPRSPRASDTLPSKRYAKRHEAMTALHKQLTGDAINA